MSNLFPSVNSLIQKHGNAWLPSLKKSYLSEGFAMQKLGNTNIILVDGGGFISEISPYHGSFDQPLTAEEIKSILN